jgi:hypothetical protein
MYASRIRPFASPRVVRERAVFGRAHLNDLHQTASLPSLLEIGRAYLLCGELEKGEKCFRRIYNVCMMNVAEKSTIPLLFASSCVCLARVEIAKIRNSGGINGSKDYDNNYSKMAEHALSLLDRAIVDASVSLGLISVRHPKIHAIFLGETMGCMGELLESLPEMKYGNAGAASNNPLIEEQPLRGEPIVPYNILSEKIATTFVNAVAMCVSGLQLEGDDDSGRRGNDRDITINKRGGGGGMNEKGDSAMNTLPLSDPYSDYDWYGDALVDLCRFNKNAANYASSKNRNSDYYIQLAERVAALAVQKFGGSRGGSSGSGTLNVEFVDGKEVVTGHSIIGQAMHDLGRVRASQEIQRRSNNETVTSGPLPKDMRQTRAILSRAQQSYENAGVSCWSVQ